MNENLIYKDGKALIISDGKNIKEIDYYDNLNEVLKKENLIEKLDIQIFELEQDIFEYEEKKYTKKDMLNVILSDVVALLLVYVMFENVFDLGKVVNTTIFGDVNIFTLITIVGTPVVGLVGAAMIVPIVIKNKELNSIINGKKTTIKYLKKELEKAKDIILELRKDKTCSKNNKEMSVLSIKDDENIEEIKRNMNIYYNLGYYQKKNEKKKSDSTICYPLSYGEILEDNDKDLQKRRIKKR